VISEILGYATVRFTTDTYPEAAEELADARALVGECCHHQ
jgi:hypothetical protein